MSTGVAGILIITAALATAGLLAAVRGRDLGARLAGIPALAAAAGIGGAGVSRFGTGLRQPAVGHELAILAGVFALAAAIAVTWLLRAGPAPTAAGPAPVGPARRQTRGRRR